MKYDAVVTRVVQEAPSVSTVYFTIDGGTVAFIAGQYISVYFEQTGKKSGKAYSLSSAPRDNELSITVKDIGEFSHLICSLKKGDHFLVSSPFGFFNSNDDLPIAAIAAGVGISPIWSIIRDELETTPLRELTVYLSAPHENELVFRQAIDELCAQSRHATAHYFVTRESSACAKPRRFVVSDDVAPRLLTEARFYVCGAEAFVRDVWRQLMEAGVDESRIVTETFFESTL